ncbi:MAG: 2,3-bisphosphoglycerate-independent phosphoglycerate mutase [Coriobacteriia bacterium]|nr:2,3-bisphosphoglycerate-independent phosphoglycerate mutase [Coriobacteriia bacterium]
MELKHGSTAPVCLIIMDGLAYGVKTTHESGNAVAKAHTPVLDALVKTWPHSQLEASGSAVGLPQGQMGNSEVGHLNIGAGRVVYQELTRIDKAIEDGSFFKNEVLVCAIEAAVERGKTVHFMGLLSDGGVHSSDKHLYALLELAKSLSARDVAIHCFMDGRDTAPQSGKGYLRDLEDHIDEIGVGKIATVIGRYYAMDRDKRFDRVERAYNALVLGEGVYGTDALSAIEESYRDGIYDEFVEPTVLAENPIADGDTVIFFNFRSDRAREITRAFVDSDFDGFIREKTVETTFVCLTQYDPTISALVAFPKEELPDVLADVLAAHGLRQLHIAETEKYAHVTFFFNGGVEPQKDNEERVLVASPKVATYDMQPEMSAAEVGDDLVKAINAREADFYVVNFANGDMVGHTGDFDAAVAAIETVDTQVGRVVEAMLNVCGASLITADHGNCEHMLYDGGTSPCTAHTCNPVPFIAVGAHAAMVKNGVLSDIAPTILFLLKIPAPSAWTGKNLVVY